MDTTRIVIGCRTAGRVDGLTRAIAGRHRTFTTINWPLEQAIRAGRDADTAVIVLDGFPAAVDLRTMARVTADRPELSVLVLGPLEPSIEALVALASGASGYLPADSTPEAVADAVDALLLGEAVFPHRVSASLLQHLRSGGRGIVVPGPDRSPSKLTSREWEILVLLRQGHSTADIARHLVLSKGTVRTHVASVVRKLGAHDRRALGLPYGTVA